MEFETCRVCGGDGQIGNAFGGSSSRCPACSGVGRRSQSESVFHDVTKTKPSHYKSPSKQEAKKRAELPTTPGGIQLADEVKASDASEETKARLIREISEHEGTHGRCTQTFIKKTRKQIRP